MKGDKMTKVNVKIDMKTDLEMDLNLKYEDGSG